MQDDKFRSISAFKEFEQKRPGGSTARSLGTEGAPRGAMTVSPLTVLSRVKKSATGMSHAELVRELEADPQAIDDAVLRLIKEDLVVLQPGDDGERIVAA